MTLIEQLLQSILPAISVFGTLLIINGIIIFHELGHYYAALACRLIPKSVCVGFGRLVSQVADKNKTMWQVRLWPLGGYVDLCGTSKRAIAQYHALRYRQKAFILLGGVTANILLAIILFWAANIIGFEYRTPIIGSVQTNSIAEQNQIKTGDEITQVNQHHIMTWQDVAYGILQAKASGSPIRISVIRDGSIVDIEDIKSSSVFTGEQSGLFSLGFEAYTPPWPAIITAIEQGSPANLAGLQVGDEITQINHTDIESATTLLQYIHDHPDQKITITSKRNQQQQKRVITLGSKGTFSQKGFLGIRIAPPSDDQRTLKVHKTTVFIGILHAFSDTFKYLMIQCIAFYLLTIGQLSMNTMGGPILIFAQTYALFSLENMVLLLQWTAAINISLAFINLIPIPIFDGGRLLILTIETMTGLKLSAQAQGQIDRVTVALLIGLAAMVAYNDLLRALGLT